MQIDAHKRTLGEVLQQGQHVIPRYQRRYAWESQNIRDFWNDIMNATDPHFLGSMVTSGTSSAPREVIDGQQRLTTAIIALSVLRDLYTEIDALQRVNGINEYLEYVDRNGDKNHRLKNKDNSAATRLNDNVLIARERRTAAPGFDSQAPEFLASQVFEQLAREFISKDSEPTYRIDSIRDSILESEVVYINVEDRKNAFTIFETLNDRGKSLTVMDLVKNMLFAEIAAGDEDSSERGWSEVLLRLDDSTFEGMTPDRFLYYAWNSRHHLNHSGTDIVETSRLRRSIAEHVSAAPDHDKAARDLISGLQSDASILAALNQTLISNGSPDPWKDLDDDWRRDQYEPISDHIYGILVTGANQPFPLLLSLMRAYLRPKKAIQRKTLLAFLKSVETFQFRWTLAQKTSTSTQRTLYRQAASLISASQSKAEYEASHKAFLTVASKIDATDAQFRDGIQRLAYSRTRSKDTFHIRHILTRIEKSYGTTKLNLSHQMSLEHLQGLEGRSEATPRNSWIFKIGNLTLLPAEVNASLPKEFAAKSGNLEAWVSDADKVLLRALAAKSWKAEQASERMALLIQHSLILWPRLSNELHI